MIRTFLITVTLFASSALAAEPAPTFKKLQLTGEFFSEGAAFGDINRDGKNDIVSGPFWYEGPDFKNKHRYGPGDAVDPHKYSTYFLSWVQDIDKDGWPDIFVAGFPGADASWFRNPASPDGTWTRHVVLDKVDNESPNFIDITGDGEPDLLCMSGGYLGYAARPSDPTKPWDFHRVSPELKFAQFTHGLGYGDINGDGKIDLLERTGWWEQPDSLDKPEPWKHHATDFGPGGAQMYAFDVNGDGLNDVITSLQAHGYGLAWFEQIRDAGNISFKKHLIMGEKETDNPYGVKFTQPHAVAIADIDGDGLLDIVTGKRWWAHGPNNDAEPGAPAVLYWFGLTRPEGKESLFVPHKIDDNSGVGTQCTVGDVNADHKPDVVIGNKKGTFLFLQN